MRGEGNRMKLKRTRSIVDSDHSEYVHYWFEDDEQVSLGWVKVHDYGDGRVFLCDIETRVNREGVGIQLVDALLEEYQVSCLYTTGGCTPSGYRFLNKLHKLRKVELGSSSFTWENLQPSYHPIQFVEDWDAMLLKPNLD
jgi:hypothetical protein